jgi:2-iminobutanoate/2-iminopropanoate deaminase
MPDYPPAPDPLSGFPYSNVVVSGDLVAIASQTPFDDSQHLVGPGFTEQAHQVFANLRRCLQTAGCDLADVIKVTTYLARVDFMTEYNDIYREYFQPPYPARSTIACSLVVPGMLLQIDAFARRPPGPAGPAAG